MFRTGVNFDDEIFKMNADGSGVTNLTNTGPGVEERPVWSPAGNRIAFTKGAFTAAEVWTMNPDGTGQVRVTTNSFLDAQPSWQPSVLGYPRPTGASPLKVSLVPAYVACAEREPHPRPAARASRLRSSRAVLAARHGRYPGRERPGCEVDRLREDDHRDRGPLIAGRRSQRAARCEHHGCPQQASADGLTGQLQVAVSLRITDRDNGCCPTRRARRRHRRGLAVVVHLTCAATSDTTIGSTCSIATTADALVPGMVTEGKRAIWQVGQVQVTDGGEDGIAATAADNTLFAKQGLFVP